MMRLRAQLSTFFFFAYGSLSQLALLRLAVLYGYSSTDPGRSFVDSHLVNLGVCLFGGAFTALVMFRATQKPAEADTKPSRTQLLLRCGLYGLLTTFLTFQAFFATAALYLVITIAHQEGGVSLLPLTFLWPYWKLKPTG